MLTKRENLLQTVRGGNPDRYVNQFEAFAMVTAAPIAKRNPKPRKGELNVVNAWGVTRSFPEGTPGPFPVHTPDKIVVKDIERWEDYVKIPQTVFESWEWEESQAAAEKIDRNEYLVTVSAIPGIFEQCHYLMEIQNCLMAFYEYPEEMHGLIDAITQYELDYAREVCKYLKPDALLHHDDWGSQLSTFLSPEMFREFFKDAYTKIYGYYKSQGVQVIMHHSDSYAATLVGDMVDMGIDIWQGAMSSNDIPALLKTFGDQITIMGGIDNGKIDRSGWTEEAIRPVVDAVMTSCTGGRFIPCMTGGGPGSTFPGVYGTVSRIIDEYNARDDLHKR